MTAANYQTIGGTEIQVSAKGKGFAVAITYPATKRSESETVIKNCATYASVERLLKKFNV